MFRSRWAESLRCLSLQGHCATPFPPLINTVARHSIASGVTRRCPLRCRSVVGGTCAYFPDEAVPFAPQGDSTLGGQVRSGSDYYSKWDKLASQMEEEDEEGEEEGEAKEEEAGKKADGQAAVQRLSKANMALSQAERDVLALREKEKGNDLFRAREFESALAAYTLSLELSPGNAAVLANRATVHMKRKQWAMAEDDCTAALEIEPKLFKVPTPLSSLALHPFLSAAALPVQPLSPATSDPELFPVASTPLPPLEITKSPCCLLPVFPPSIALCLHRHVPPHRSPPPLHGECLPLPSFPHRLCPWLRRLCRRCSEGPPPEWNKRTPPGPSRMRRRASP